MTSQNKRTIEELCLNVTSGGTPSRGIAQYWEDGTVDWFKTGELSDWYLDGSEEKITEEGLTNSSAKVFPKDTILMAMYGDGRTITSLGLLSAAAATNQACCAMIVDPSKCNHLYLFYALKHHRHELLSLVVAGAQRNLSGGIIKRFPVTYHPLPIQEVIAKTLSQYDSLIDNNRRRIKLLETSASLLYKEWFVHLRFPGHDHSKFTDGVPYGWTKERLGNLLTLQRGFDLPLGSRKEGDVPIYASTGINGFHNESKVSGPGVVTGRSGSLGTVMYVSGKFWPLNTTLWVKEFKKTTPAFATFLLRTMSLENYNGGAAVPTLNRNDVHGVEVLCPEDRLIRDFDAYVNPIFTQIEKLKEHSKKLESARELLLPRLMNGDIAA